MSFRTKGWLAAQLVAAAFALSHSNPAIAGGDGGSVPFLWVQVSVHNSQHACALGNNGGIACWGQNWFGQLGNPYVQTGSSNPSAYADVAVPVLGLPGPASSVAVGPESTCAIMTFGGSVWCWGDNQLGQLGNGKTSPSVNNVPQQVVGLQAPAISVTIGSFHTCAVLNTGQVSCWGSNDEAYTLGDGSLSAGQYELTPHLVPNTSGVSFVSASDDTTCTIDRNPQWVTGKGLTWAISPMCWGENGSAQTGQPNVPNDAPVPPAIMTSLSDIQSLSEGNEFTCAVSAVHGALCWGFDNLFGSLGDNQACMAQAPDGVDCPKPVAVRYSNPNHAGVASAVAAGGETACDLLTDGSVWCWGDNNYGQLGTSNPNITGKKVLFYADQAFTYANATSIGVGGDFACAVVNGGTNIQCWGRNDFGQLGDATTQNASLPQWVQ